MKTIPVLVFLWLLSLSLSAQESDPAKLVRQHFIVAYNSNNYEAIEKLYSKNMQEFMPIAKMRDFSQQLKGEYFFYVHLKINSPKVNAGDRVKQGQLLAQCGNSGNSTEPHLHFHLMNTNDYANATGAKIFFKELWLIQGKKQVLQKHYLPVKGD
jgi:murein DD-endopeptidase MepM/ murein hydrolase activator NlpD